MSVRDRIVADLGAAMKSKDAVRLGVLRMVKARMLEAEVEQRAKEGADYRLSDAETLAVLSAYAKQRRDSIDAFRKGGREDLAVKEEAELAVLHEYLPRQLSADEVRDIVRQAMAETGATSLRDLGVVMKAVMPKVKGTADGKLVNDVVRAMLSAG